MRARTCVYTKLCHLEDGRLERLKLKEINYRLIFLQIRFILILRDIPVIFSTLYFLSLCLNVFFSFLHISCLVLLFKHQLLFIFSSFSRELHEYTEMWDQ